MASKLRVLGGLQDKPRGSLSIVWAASGIEMAWTWSRLLCGTWEPVVPMLREKRKWWPHKRESTKAENRGGSSRISVEGSVMGLERRGWVSSQEVMVNQLTGRSLIFLGKLETVRFQDECWQERYDGRLSRTDLWGPGGEIPPGYSTISKVLNLQKTCDTHFISQA